LTRSAPWDFGSLRDARSGDKPVEICLLLLLRFSRRGGQLRIPSAQAFEEGSEILEEEGEESVLDATIIAAAQKVEHYEIASYGTVCTFAELLGEKEAAKLLRQTLDEEGAANEKLNELAEGIVNPEALSESKELAASGSPRR
jgi:Domain of unknown function (DUF892)